MYKEKLIDSNDNYYFVYGVLVLVDLFLDD